MVAVLPHADGTVVVERPAGSSMRDLGASTRSRASHDTPCVDILRPQPAVTTLRYIAPSPAGRRLTKICCRESGRFTVTAATSMVNRTGGRVIDLTDLLKPYSSAGVITQS